MAWGKTNMQPSRFWDGRRTLTPKESALLWPQLLYIGILGASCLRRLSSSRLGWFRGWGPGNSSPCQIADLGGFACVLLWIRRGLFRFLPPAERQALLRAVCVFLRKTTTVPYGTKAVLAPAVAVTWWNNFAWEGRNRLAAEIVLSGEAPSDEEIDALCDFLWKNRNLESSPES